MKRAHCVPFSVPDLGEEEVTAAAAALRSGWVTTGPQAAAFEEAFCGYVGAGQAVAVNSGTAAMHLGLAALGIGPGDEVVTTPVTFCASVNVILQTGATPVLADIGTDLNLDPDRVEAAITPRTRAILPVHIAGLPCDMDALWGIAARHRLGIVEDAAHAAGAEYRGVKIGGGTMAGISGTGNEIPAKGAGKFRSQSPKCALRSDAVAFSFYANKNMTTGEGGMVTTGSAELAERMRMLSLHGMSRDAWNRYGENGSWCYEVVECGFKYNLSDILAAIGLVQLGKLDRMNARRAWIAARYNEAFAGLEEVELPPDRADCRHAWHLYILRLNLERLSIDRARFIEEMRARGIGCSVHFIPIPLHPYYQRVLGLRDPCERALAEYPRLVSLPLYSKMTDGDVERVIGAVREIVSGHRKRVFGLWVRPICPPFPAEKGAD